MIQKKPMTFVIVSVSDMIDSWRAVQLFLWFFFKLLIAKGKHFFKSNTKVFYIKPHKTHFKDKLFKINISNSFCPFIAFNASYLQYTIHVTHVTNIRYKNLYNLLNFLKKCKKPIPKTELWNNIHCRNSTV